MSLWLTGWAWWCAGASAVPLLVAAGNLRRYTKSRPDAPAPAPGGALVGVCIPARNEEANIGPCVRSLLAQDIPNLRIAVSDDASTDQTAAVLAGLAAEDSRVLVVTPPPLPEGWNGKQHACWQAAHAATEAGCDWLLFTDADVRFEPDALRRTLDEAARLKAPMVSTFPRQITRTLSEAAMVPMMFFLLLGYLPMGRMRRFSSPNYGAGCGQFLFVRADTYRAFDGHRAFKDTMHDGIRMPKAVRSLGLQTDLFDGSDLVSVRMYHGWRETWRGFAKNAYEGIGSLGLLVFLTLLHAGGHAAAWVIALLGLSLGWSPLIWGPAAAGCVLQIIQRAMIARRVGHAWSSVWLHPIGVILMTAVQWWSWWLQRTGRRSWRGRVQGSQGPHANAETEVEKSIVGS
jgi:glycosyltransferase involved in cell wall biosynthesis